MITKKVSMDLKSRGSSSTIRGKSQILNVLESLPNEIHTMRYVSSQTERKGKYYYRLWSSAYDLASEGKIQILDRKYHLWSKHPLLSKYASKIRCVVFHADYKLDPPAELRPEYKTNESNIISLVTPEEEQLIEEEQLPLSFADYTDDELDQLISRARSERLERALESRYRGANREICDKVCNSLRAYEVADPVALVHGDEHVVYLTVTKTKAMPIIATLKQVGEEEAITIELEHLTLHNAPLISTIKEAYQR